MGVSQTAAATITHRYTPEAAYEWGTVSAVYQIAVLLADDRRFTLVLGTGIELDNVHVRGERHGDFGTHWVRIKKGLLRDLIIALAAEHLANDDVVAARGERATWAGVAFSLISKRAAG
jgi:hypothetical protein